MRIATIKIWNAGGDALNAALIARNSRHRDRVKRRAVESLVRSLLLLRGAALALRRFDLAAITYYNPKDPTLLFLPGTQRVYIAWSTGSIPCSSALLPINQVAG
jgi:hypothetical protein